MDAAVTVLDALISVVLAPACAVCERVLERPLAGCVCEACWADVVPLTPPLCDACGAAMPSWRMSSLQQRRCARCRRAVRALDRSRALGAYEGTLRGIVHALKYGRRSSLARPLGARLRKEGADVLAGADLLAPVPLHPRRRRQRGFNQAELLARHIGGPVGTPLARVRDTWSQTSLPEAQRHRNVRGAFAATDLPVAGCCVVLIDDVTTTGATLEACARVLKASGAREVRALTVARAERRQR